MAANNFVGQMRSKGLDLAEDLKEMGVIVKDAVLDKTSQITESARDAGRRTGEQLTGYVKKAPYKSVLIAACSGAVLGWLFGRR